MSPGSEPSARQALSQSLERGLFALLTLERKIEICDVLLEIGAQDPDIVSSLLDLRHAELHYRPIQVSDIKKLLGSLLRDVPVIVQLLASLQPTTNAAFQRPSKRAKLDM
jgi:U3 small nucleolar RNA-associated protein 10